MLLNIYRDIKPHSLFPEKVHMGEICQYLGLENNDRNPVSNSFLLKSILYGMLTVYTVG